MMSLLVQIRESNVSTFSRTYDDRVRSGVCARKPRRRSLTMQKNGFYLTYDSEAARLAGEAAQTLCIFYLEEEQEEDAAGASITCTYRRAKGLKCDVSCSAKREPGGEDEVN